MRVHQKSIVPAAAADLECNLSVLVALAKVDVKTALLHLTMCFLDDRNDTTEKPKVRSTRHKSKDPESLKIKVHKLVTSRKSQYKPNL